MSDTKEQILNAAFKLFLRKSFKEVTLKDILEETGLSKGGFYHHFISKEQLFLELVNTIFASIMDVPYDQFSKESLYHFYIDYLNHYVEHVKKQNEEDSAPGFNYISLMFDAIKLFPDFQEKLQESRKIQLNSWVEVIRAARSRGEIESSMSDEQIANIFINSSGGLEMNSIFEGNSENVGKTLLSLWDSFYEELKA